MTVLMILVCCVTLIEKELGIDCIGLCVSVVVVSVGCDEELSES